VLARADEAARGEYVFRAAGCAACHTREGAPPLAGGRAFDTPFGRFYSPNITPDPRHGIGRWSADDLWRALTRGEGPGGVHYYPVFPFTSYAAMTREDSDALHAYLMSVAPKAVASKAHELPWYLRWRFAAWAWKWLFLDTRPFSPVQGRSARWNRGAYLVRALGHCGECHTSISPAAPWWRSSRRTRATSRTRIGLPSPPTSRTCRRNEGRPRGRGLTSARGDRCGLRNINAARRRGR
jgi:mono/diheme cytochrome c family protein